MMLLKNLRNKIKRKKNNDIKKSEPNSIDSLFLFLFIRKQMFN